MHQFSTEERLLLTCARLALSSELRQQLCEVLRDERLSWRDVVYKASWHRLSGLIFHHLGRIQQEDLVPSWAMRQLKATYLQTAAKNLYLCNELGKVLQTLRNQHIPVIALKGIALLESVYMNPGLRPMSDIDLLVPEELVERAQYIVRGFGYSPVGSLEAQESTRRNHRHLPTLIDPEGVAAFEVHSHIVTRDSPLRFDIGKFWARSTPVSIAGAQALTLAPEDMVVHVAIHFFLDRRFRSYGALSQICDIAEIVRRYESQMDWRLLEREVIASRVRGPVYCGLYLAKRLLDAPVPESTLEEIRPNGFRADSAELFLKRRVLDTRHVVASRLMADRRADTPLDLMKAVLVRLFPSKSYMSEHYSNGGHSRGLYRSYFHRTLTAGSLLTQYLRRPMDLWEQVSVDRWIHSLQNDGESRETDEVGSDENNGGS